MPDAFDLFMVLMELSAPLVALLATLSVFVVLTEAAIGKWKRETKP